MKMPSATLEKMKSRMTSAPAKRPSRYCHLRIGAVKKKGSVRFSKSCSTARPMIAATTVRPIIPRNAIVCEIAYGELMCTFPLPNTTFALGNAPPAAAVHSVASVRKTRK